jgi:hypothetical protein
LAKPAWATHFQTSYPRSCESGSAPTPVSTSRFTADGWRHSSIQLLPLNPAFEPITLAPEDAGNLTIVGEFVQVAS